MSRRLLVGPVAPTVMRQACPCGARDPSAALPPIVHARSSCLHLGQRGGRLLRRREGAERLVVSVENFPTRLAAVEQVPEARLVAMDAEDRGNGIAGWPAARYMFHVSLPFAGVARQRGPAFFLPGAGLIG